MNWIKQFLSRVISPLPLSILFLLLSFTILGVSIWLEDGITWVRLSQAALTASLGWMVYLESRKNRGAGKDAEQLRTALSYAASSSRSPDPESIIVQGACRFPGVKGAWLLAEVPGSRVEPLLLASAGEEVPPMEKILATLRDDFKADKWVSMQLPRWPGSPPYRVVLELEEQFSKERLNQMESYAQLAGGYLASGTALREYSVANNRLQELEKEMELARQRLIRESRNALMGKLVSNIAHELNNPLAAVLGSTQVLRTMEKDPKTMNILDQLLAETHRCKEIVDHVTSLAENAPAEEAQIEMHPTLDEVFNLLQYRFRRERIELVKNYCDENFRLKGDAALLSQALLNLGNLMAEILPSAAEPRSLQLSTQSNKEAFVLNLSSGNPVEIQKGYFDRPGTKLSLWVATAIFEEYGAKLDSSRFRSRDLYLRIEFPKKSKTPSPLRENSSTLSM